MNILKLNIYFGISIVMKYNAIFINLLKGGHVDEIHVSLAMDVLKLYRDTYSETYCYNFYKIMNYIFTDSRIKVFYNEQFPVLNIVDLIKKYNTSFTYSILPQINALQPILPFEYITISTKVMNALSYSEYQMIKPMLYSILSDLTLPIILLGEKKVIHCHEYEIHSTYSIYEDLKIHLPNAIDRTVASTESTTELLPLLESLSILNKSKLNIFMTCSGISAIIFFTSSSFLGLTTDYYDDTMFEHKTSSMCIISDSHTFLDILYTRISELNEEYSK